MKLLGVHRRSAVVFSLLMVIVIVLLSPTTTLSSPQVRTQATLIDITISLYSSPASAADRAPYERIIRYFADGVYEASNGAHKIQKVTIYTGGNFADRADVVWVASCHPNAAPSGRSVQGGHVNFCDTFSTYKFLDDDKGGQEGGYTLAHEWGHYFYGLYDEYRGLPSYDTIFHFPHSNDDAVPNSIMHNQFNAVDKGSGHDYNWLNFSTAISDTRNTAQHRVYGASCWETLARPVADDPRDGQRKALPQRIYYADLAAVAPTTGTHPAIDLPAAAARSGLDIVWVSGGDSSYQIVIDHSGSMMGTHLDNAKTAAKLLVDLAQINHTTIGVIKFDDTVSVVQSLTAIDSQATKTDIKNEIDKISAGGSTAIGDAAQQALDDLLASTAISNTNRVVYLLTDGYSNTGVAPLSVIPAYQSAQIPLFTFGYGSNADTATLQQMANDTGGRYYSSPTTLAELTQVFQDAQQLTSPSVGIATGSTTVQSGTPSSTPICVDSTLSRLNLVITYDGSPGDVDLTLLDPSDTLVDTADCSASGTETICLLDADSLTSGDWKLKAEASSSDVDLTYRASGSAEDRFTYATSLTSLTGDVVQYPEPIVLLAIPGKEVPILGAGVSASVEKPDGTVTSFALLDDGVAPDAEADDGLYSAILDYDQDGTYNITAQFDNSAGTAELTELGLQPSIGPDGEALPIADSIPITENFERFARIQITVEGVQSDDHEDDPDWSATDLGTDNTDIAGKIDSQGDVDVFEVSVSSAGELVLRVSNLALGMDPRLRVFASDGTTVLADVDLTTSASDNGYLYIPISVSAGGTVYAEVSHRSGTGSGGVYEISAGSRISSDAGGLGRTSIYLPLVLRSYGADRLYFEDFSDSGSGWRIGDYTNYALYYYNGNYRMQLKQANWNVWAWPGFTCSDCTIEVEAWRSTGANSRYGIVFGLDSSGGQGYFFIVQPGRQEYSLYRYDGGTWTNLIPYTGSSYINSYYTHNLLRVTRDGSQIRLYVNDHYLNSCSDSTYTGSRRVGLYAGSGSTSPVYLRYDDFTVWGAGYGTTSAIGDGSGGIGATAFPLD